MKKEQKSQIIDEIAKDLADYPNVYVTDISGFTVDTVNQLRRQCFRNDIKLKVVKNTLLKRAMEQVEGDYSEIEDTLKGSTAIMLSTVDFSLLFESTITSAFFTPLTLRSKGDM